MYGGRTGEATQWTESDIEGNKNRIRQEEMENNMVAKEMMDKLTKDLKHEV